MQNQNIFLTSGKSFIFEYTVILYSIAMISSHHFSCDKYWDAADWLPPLFILERWCKGDEDCMQAKLQALLSACERGVVQYRRNDKYSFDDPVHDLYSRRKLLIERKSFDLWCVALEGKSPISEMDVAKIKPKPVTPDWANQYSSSLPKPPIQKPSEVEIPEPEIDASTRDKTTESEASEPDATESLPLTESQLRSQGVPADEIIEAFRIKPDPGQNRQWWTERFSNATRYKKILNARIQKGQSSRGEQHFPSWWNPQLIGVWLIEGRHMQRDRVLRVLEHSFPDFSDRIDYM